MVAKDPLPLFCESGGPLELLCLRCLPGAPDILLHSYSSGQPGAQQC